MSKVPWDLLIQFESAIFKSVILVLELLFRNFKNQKFMSKSQGPKESKPYNLSHRGDLLSFQPLSNLTYATQDACKVGLECVISFRYFGLSPADLLYINSSNNIALYYAVFALVYQKLKQHSFQ